MTTGALVDSSVDGSGFRGWERNEDHLAARTVHPQDAVAVFLAQIADAGTTSLEDPQLEQAQQRDQGEVVRVGRMAGGGVQCLELQMAETESW